MGTEGRVKLDTRFVALNFLNTGARDGQDITIWVPLDVLDQHSSVHQDGLVVSHVAHQLHAATLVSDAKGRCLLVLVLI